MRILLGHIAAVARCGLLLQMEIAWPMVCLSVMIVSPAKMAEPIEMPFWLWTRMVPRNRVLDWCPDLHTRKGPAQYMPGHV